MVDADVITAVAPLECVIVSPSAKLVVVVAAYFKTVPVELFTSTVPPPPDVPPTIEPASLILPPPLPLVTLSNAKDCVVADNIVSSKNTSTHSPGFLITELFNVEPFSNVISPSELTIG